MRQPEDDYSRGEAQTFYRPGGAGTIGLKYRVSIIFSLFFFCMKKIVTPSTRWEESGAMTLPLALRTFGG